jgi:polyhydroxybutyrate depolymerase
MPDTSAAGPTAEPGGSEIARPRLVRAAGVAGLLVPVVWVASVGLEISQGQLSHSLVSRPERLFGAADSRWFAVLLVAGAVLAILQLLVAGGMLLRAERRRVAGVAFAVAVVAAAARYGVSVLAPDPHLYGVSQARGLAALVLLTAMPAALVLAGAALGGRGRAMAWLAAVLAVAMVWVAADWTVWSLRSGALQPQLWAVEPVEALAAAWFAVSGLRLLGAPAWIRSRFAPEPASGSGPGRASGMRLPAIPGPGRKASVVLVLAAVVGVVGVSGPFVRDYATTISSQLAGRTQVETIRVGDVDRTYRVYRPARPAAQPGLVFVLHGVFGDGFIMEANSGFDAQADRLGWIAVYPDGVADGWDAFGSGPTWGLHPGADDVAFISDLIDRLEASDAVDPSRVYVTGLSRGAMMTYRLGCELSDRIAAIAPVSGNMATADGSADVPCTLARPVSVLAIHGTADGTIPINGGTVDIKFSPLADVIARWRNLDACAGTQAVTVDGASTTTSWVCRGGSTVAVRVVAGGYHTWPVSSSLPTPLGPDDFDAARLIADFFVAHPLIAAGG